MLSGSWMVPGSLFCLFWFAYTFIPLVALWSVPIDPRGMGYIFSACAIFSLTSYAFKWKGEFHKASLKPFKDDFDSAIIRTLFFTTSSFVIISILIDLMIQGVTIKSMLTEPVAIVGKMIDLRYKGLVRPNIFKTITTILHQPAVILGALFYFGRDHRGMVRPFLLAFIFLPACLLLILHGDKGSLFYDISLFFGALLIIKIRSGKTEILNPTDLKKLFLFAILVFSLVFFAFLARYTGLELPKKEEIHPWISSPQTYVTRMFASYAAGHIYAFSDWFAEMIKANPNSVYTDNLGRYGFYTFMAIAKLISSQNIETPAGYYAEYFYYGGILKTNIYTFFRGLINDFGIVGSFFAMLIFGFACNIIFLSLLRFKQAALSVPLFIYAIGFFYTSYMISLFTWNSPFVGSILVFLFLKLNDFFLARNRRNLMEYLP